MKMSISRFCRSRRRLSGFLAEPCASVYTHNRKLMEKLFNMSMENQQIRLIAQDQYSACFSVPKSCISVRKPYSDERRARDSERAKAAGISPPRV